MRWKNVSLIFLREIRDQLRDRRTLFMVAVLPLLLYPGLGIGMVQMLVLFQEQPRTVVILGEKHLPEQPQLLLPPGDEAGLPRRFVGNWFTVSGDADKLEVFTDRPGRDDDKKGSASELERLLETARSIREKYNHRQSLADRLSRLKEKQSSPEPRNDSRTLSAKELDRKLAETAHELETANEELSRLFAASGIQVLIIVPDRFDEHLDEMNRRIRDRRLDREAAAEYEGPVIIHNKADKKSQIAYRRVSEAVESWEKSILTQRLRMAHLPESLTTPVNAEPVNLAKQEDMSDSLWSVLFPALLIVMSITGAFYPAVDLAAGEKERGTMETLLICPATRTEIVIGKFLTIMVFSMSTAVLNLASMGLTGQYMMSFAQHGSLAKFGNLAPPSMLGLVWVAVLLVPLAALFSALCLALATFARSSKEGQYYQTPLLVITLGLTVFCLSPAVEITPFYSIMPIVGPALLLKELLASQDSARPLVYSVPVLLTSVGYSLLALWWAIEQFNREDVLFREAERFELGLWVRHLLRDKETTPSFAEAGACFVLMVLLQFVTLKFFNRELLEADSPARVLKLQMVYLIMTIASPALFLTVILTRSIRETLKLKLPNWKMLAAAAVLPVVLNPLSVELLARLEWFFPEFPAGAARIVEAMSAATTPWWLALLAFALVPAVCEELAFRGFILSGFSRSRRKWLAIVLSAVTFGVAHMVPQLVFNATLLGLVLGLITLRSGSLLPAIVFHFIYNSLQVVRSRVGTDWVPGTPAEWFFTIDGDLVRYQWTTLVMSAAVAIWLLRWLVNQPLGPFPAVSAEAGPDQLPEAGIAEKTSVGA